MGRLISPYSFFFFLLLGLLPRPFVSLGPEGLLLLSAKLWLSDPHGSLSDWLPSDSTPCSWSGVTCSPPSGTSTSRPTVTSIDLAGRGLAGPLPPPICRLPRLAFLSLSGNNLTELPSASLAGCSSVTHLDLSRNSLAGPLPSGLPWMLPLLLRLDLSYNNFSGHIPPSYSRFRQLRELSLVGNKISGEVPPELEDLKLGMLNLSYNQLSGKLPPSFMNPVYTNSFLGNPQLCLDPAGQCTTKVSGGGVVWLLWVLLLLFALFLVTGVVWFCWCKLKEMIASCVGSRIVPANQTPVMEGSGGAPVSSK